MVGLVKRLVPYRQTIVDQIQQNIPDLRDVAPHVGNFGVETLTRFSSLTPCARVSFMGMKAMKRDNVGHMVGPAVSCVFICDKDPLKGQVYGPALDLAERVADFIDFNQFGLDYVAAALVTEIEPVYSEALDELGIALVGVCFEQMIQIGRSKHDVDAETEDFGDLTGLSWPANVTGNGSVAIGAPNPDGGVFPTVPGDFSADDPDLY